MNSNTKSSAYLKATILVAGILVATFGMFNFAGATTSSQYSLQSIIVWESSSTSGGPDSYYFGFNDQRFTSKISSFGANSANDMPGTVENYDVYFSDANGNFNPNGLYITIDSYRNSNKANIAVGGNISAVQLNLSNGTSVYASSVARVVNGTGLSGNFTSTQGYASNALGAPIFSGTGSNQPAPGFKTTYLGDHFSSITLGFTMPVLCADNATKQCSGNSVYWYDSCGNKQGLYQSCTQNQTCSNGSCVTNPTPPPPPPPPPSNDLVVSCYSTPNPLNVGQQISFI
ncbi:MAG: hypothetical protein Q8Q48_02120, partial [Candidatus Staskawiczbacteria bacterium]|nr:hypothetical protein [Candidatus Staskawiczbacteria bacterium]